MRNQRRLGIVVLVAAVFGWTAAADAKLTFFKSPSGNIGCAIGNGSVRCDVGDHTWRAPRPKGCPAISDYGQGVTLFRGPATVVCASDSVLWDRAPVLGYGRSKAIGSITCTSRQSGMSCRKTTTRHGFFVSKSRYRLF